MFGTNRILRGIIKNLEEENAKLSYKNKELKHNNLVLIETNRDYRSQMQDLENNIEVLFNTLTPKKRELARPYEAN